MGLKPGDHFTSARAREECNRSVTVLLLLLLRVKSLTINRVAGVAGFPDQYINLLSESLSPSLRQPNLVFQNFSLPAA